ncbi:MAG TPA: hypothetical protein VGL46_05155 [Pseudonocardiaceae bacterium]|jgi:hypothetical protein
MSSDWFAVQGARLSTGVVVLPMVYAGDEPLVGAEAWVSGEHVVEAIGQGNVITDKLAELGDLRPGDKCLIMVSLDGAPGAHTISLRIRAAGDRVRLMTVEVPGGDGSLVITERPKP